MNQATKRLENYARRYREDGWSTFKAFILACGYCRTNWQSWDLTLQIDNLMDEDNNER
jgi:hypothetical protein